MKMANAVRKEILCNFCQTEKDANLIYTAKKVFAGRRVIDMLKTVSQRSVPGNVTIKICNVCASNLMTMTAMIEKTQQLIEQGLDSQKKKTTTTTQTADQQNNECEEENPLLEVIDLDEKAAEIAPENKKKSNSKKIDANKSKENILLPPAAGSPKKSATSPTKKTAASKLDTSDDTPVPSSPKKAATVSKKTGTPKINKTIDADEERDLVDAVKLTTSNAKAKKNHSLNQLFGKSETINVNVSDSENDDGPPAATEVNKQTETKAKPVSHIGAFGCKLCDFNSKTAKNLKVHLKSVHNQQRPRVYFCDFCPKSFGVLKTLTEHLNSHGDIKSEESKKNDEQRPKKTKSKEPQATKPVVVAAEPTLAVLTALNEPKPTETNINPEYTFQINGESASTPKPIVARRKSMNFQCEICDSEVQTVKLMQQHMQTAHQIEKPKIFKCNTCDKQFSSKQGLDFHSDKHFNNNNTESKALRSAGKTKEAEPKEAKLKQLKLSLPQSEEEDKIKLTKEDSKKSKSSPIKKPEDIEKSPVKKAKIKSEKIINLDNTEISLLSNDEESTLNQTVMKSPFKKMKEKVIETAPSNDKELSPNKSSKRKRDLSFSSTVESKNDLVQSTTIQEDEINHKVKPHKKTRLESVVYSENDLEITESYIGEEEEPVNCNQCGKSVPSRKRLESHIKKRHAKTLICPICMSIFSCHLEYVSHFGECDTSNGLACGIRKCKKVFQDDDFLISHLEKKHEWS
ncbi:zinc finger protein indra [Drosophila tropicalis]|uniref:zinc finger protein indra n=1 Tax=Drosophila tropicalis TaxID=46794 RepID=UPI0035ABB2C7